MSKPHPVTSPAELKPEKLRARAARCGAALTFTPRQALMIRRGASSWHCSDAHAAVAILRDLEQRGEAADRRAA